MGRFVWPLAAIVGAVGCAKQEWPAAFAPSKYTVAQLSTQKDQTVFVPPAPVAQALNTALLAGFGTPAAPAVAKGDAARNAAILRGSRLYRNNCMYCHGMNGDGAGPSAAQYDPRPRDYRRGAFKWKSTLANSKPLRADLRRTLMEGVGGTSMPPFKLLPPDQVDDLVEYVVFLAQRGETEYNLLRVMQEDLPEKPDELAEYLKEEWPQTLKQQTDRVAKSWDDAAVAKDVVPLAGTRVEAKSADDPEFVKSVERGRDLFLGAGGCVKCHGVDGKGGGRDLKADLDANMDVWGFPTKPRNLAEGVFRGGRAPIDLYRRVHQGIGPSKMPGAATSLKPEQMWDLVNFLRTLPYRPELLPPAGSAPAPNAAAPAAPGKSG